MLELEATTVHTQASLLFSEPVQFILDLQRGSLINNLAAACCW
jgi:hypothetical protein